MTSKKIILNTNNNKPDVITMNIEEFIKYIITFDNVDSILHICKTQSEKGFIYERLWDICIKFGFCNHFQKPEFTHMIGNVNNGNLKPLTTFTHYLTEKVCSGNSSGCSDISLFNNVENTFTFISSKYPKSKDDITKQKSVDYYDIQKIICMIDNNKHIYTQFNIYLLVPDKKSVLEKVQNANKSSNYITKYMNEQNILDKHDLNKSFICLKTDILKQSKKCTINYDELYLSTKCNLCLRFHQELITQKTSTLIEEGNKSFLWGCKCRSGKTYMIGGLIINQFEIKKKINVLIITPAPTETAPQFTDDLFNKFKDFEPFKIHYIEGSVNIKKIKLEDNNIFIMSKQLLQKYIDDNTIMKIKNLNLDIIGFDENHFSGTTNLSKSILDSYSSKNTVKVYLTATYNKPLHEWNIPEECQMYWDIEDEQICKSILANSHNIDKLKDKHVSSCVESTIKYFTDKKGSNIIDMFTPYENMPDLYLITTMFDSQRYDIIKDKIMGSKYGFCFDVLFTLNAQKTKFKFENEVSTILRFISGSNKETDFKNGDKSMFSRIFNICSNKETRIPFTQIWFLPRDNINQISTCLKQLMLNDNVLQNYNVLCINRKNIVLAKDIKENITKQEKIAKSKGKRGLILLAGNMLTLGITLHNCDAVVLMNNSLSADKVLQQMYRCMTEGHHKKCGFVVDLNISRVINTCINYTIYKNDKSIEDKIKYLTENHLINIDVDIMEQKKLDSDALVSKLMDIWKSDPINSFKSLLRNLDNDYIDFDTSTQQIINKNFTSSIKDNSINTTIELKNGDDESQELPTGKEIVQDNSDEDKSSKNNSDSDTDSDINEIKISFTKDVLPYVIPLTCILTIQNTNKDFVKMLNDIQENPELVDIFDDMCLIWWNKKDLINLIKNIVSKFFDKKSNTYNISVNFKMSIQSLIDNPKELLELINECLKPKEIEKKKFGEVFTPMDFINNKMLKDLEVHYSTKYNKNIYEDETLTWGDTTTGMGNFPIAIYYKLMDGLQHKIPNEKYRKKHILENMLFMAEYNKKNCFIVNQIFNINNEYKLNLYEGDSLQLDIKKEFGIDKFDIIIGNPPYNEELKLTGAKALYNKFVEYYIDKCKLLCFVIPSRWFSGGKGLDSFRKHMLQRNDIVYIKHFDNASTIFGNTVSIKGGVNYFLKDINHNGDCNFNGSNTQLNKYDVLVDGKYHSLIDKVSQFESITCLYLGRYFGIESNDKRLHNNTINTIKCYVSQQKGFEKYIDKNTIKKEYNFWKVITARAAHQHQSGFGNTFIGSPNEIHTGSYISFKVSTEYESKSLISYLKCKLPNFMLSLRKSSQDIQGQSIKWIPLPILNKEWTDGEIYKHFKLSDDDIKLINDTNIIGYNNNNNSNNTKLEQSVTTNNSPTNMNKKTNKELIEICKQKSISGYSGKNKASLIKLIESSNK
jgi:hypothetical protein